MVSENLEPYTGVVCSVTGDRRSTAQIVLSFEPRSDLLDHFATIGIIVWSFLLTVTFQLSPSG